MAEDGLLCWNCGKPTGVTSKVFRSDECTSCLAALRCCRGCRHYEPYRRFQCKEAIEKNLPDKEKANFCDFFQMRNVIKTPGGISTATDTKESRKKKFDDLFDD